MAKQIKKSSGERKKHGPKQKLFHEYSKCERCHMAKASMLSKYFCKEAFVISCQKRGIKNVTDDMWINFSAQKGKSKKDAWLKNISCGSQK